MITQTLARAWHRPATRLSLLLLLGLGVAGCAAGAGWTGTIAVALSFAALVLGGCSTSHGTGEDAAVTDAAREPDAADVDAGEGTWEPCCVDGVVETCFCEAGWACNYGAFVTCADGTCAYDPSCQLEDGGVDAGVDAGSDAGLDAGPEDVDAGGYWEPCCVDGMIDTCFCPAGAACNYGWFTDCGDGTCVDPTAMCPAP